MRAGVDGGRGDEPQALQRDVPVARLEQAVERVHEQVLVGAEPPGGAAHVEGAGLRQHLAAAALVLLQLRRQADTELVRAVVAQHGLEAGGALPHHQIGDATELVCG